MRADHIFIFWLLWMPHIEVTCRYYQFKAGALQIFILIRYLPRVLYAFGSLLRRICNDAEWFCKQIVFQNTKKWRCNFKCRPWSGIWSTSNVSLFLTSWRSLSCMYVCMYMCISRPQHAFKRDGRAGSGFYIYIKSRLAIISNIVLWYMHNCCRMSGYHNSQVFWRLSK